MLVARRNQEDDLLLVVDLVEEAPRSARLGLLRGPVPTGHPHMQRELPLRITVLHPVPGVTHRLQQGRFDLVPPVAETDDRLCFDFTLRVVEGPAGEPVLRGPCAQGPPAGRFVYINTGTSAGQLGSCWTRRAKVPLAGITWELIEQALAGPDSRLEARIEGRGRDGGPVCATVPLVAPGWAVRPQGS